MTDDRIERLIGGLLRVGVMIAATPSSVITFNAAARTCCMRMRSAINC